jgi:DNA-binding NarL/FixJ family response regulator
MEHENTFRSGLGSCARISPVQWPAIVHAAAAASRAARAPALRAAFGTLDPLVRDKAPDLAIVDIRMPPMHNLEGLEVARVIRQELPQIGILVLSAHAEVEHAMELLASGPGIGYLLKSRVTDVAEFIETLGRIARGGSVVDPALVRELVSIRRRNDPLDALSPREREVLELIAEGCEPVPPSTGAMRRRGSDHSG